MKAICSIALLVIAFSACNETNKTGTTSASKNYVTTIAEMHKIVVGNGEAVYQAEGKNHDMQTMSFVITETKPGGGPPLHVHPVEEAHVVLSGTVKYIIGDTVFTVTAPF